MPHEYLDFEKVSVEGLLTSADLLTDYRIAEAEATEKERNKNPRLREGAQKTKRAGQVLHGRTKNLPNKRK